MKIDWWNAYSVERELAPILLRQEQYGWLLDVDKANSLVEYILTEEERLSTSVLPHLPKVIKKGNELKSIFKKDRSYSNAVISWINSLRYDDFVPTSGRITSDSNVISGPFTRLSFDEPSLTSTTQLKAALLSLGWEPDEWNYKKDKNKKFVYDEEGNKVVTSPKITESSLDSIQSNDGWALDLVQLLKVQARKKFFVGGDYDEDADEVSKGLLSHIRPNNTIPSEVLQTNTNTGRATHLKVANVPRPSSFLGTETRALFKARPGRLIVGTDYGALESRIMADAIYRYTKHKYGKGDERFLEIILNTDDIHTYLWDDLRDLISTRNNAKTINYAFPYGAQERKLGLSCDLRPHSMSPEKAGKRVLEVMQDKFPGLVETRDATIQQAKCGWVPGLDGRKIYIRSPHSAFNAKIQGWGAAIVKMGIILKYRQIQEEGIDSEQVGWYHDEWQDEVAEHAVEDNIRISAKAVADSGIFYNISCPMVSESKLGKNWAETH